MCDMVVVVHVKIVIRVVELCKCVLNGKSHLNSINVYVMKHVAVERLIFALCFNLSVLSYHYNGC